MHGTPAEFAVEWIAAWNNSDLEALMAHYSDNVTFTSPRAAAVTGSAIVRGKDALRVYWSSAIQRAKSRCFTLDRVLWDAEQAELVIVYVNEVDGQRLRACELFRFGPDGLVTSGEAMYGAIG
jgi:steroid delta-isomerase